MYKRNGTKSVNLEFFRGIALLMVAMAIAATPPPDQNHHRGSGRKASTVQLVHPHPHQG